MLKYDVSVATSYRYIDWAESNEEYHPEPIINYKSFKDWVENYHEPSPVLYKDVPTVSLKEDSLILCMSDTHLGSKFCNMKQIYDDLSEVLKYNNVFIVFVGDLIDYGPSGPRDLIFDQQVGFKTQKEIAMSLASDFGHRFIALTAGCHSYFSGTGDLIEEEFAKKSMNGIFLQGGGLLNLKVGEHNYGLFMSHKTKSKTRMNPSLGMMRINEQDLDFDIGIEAHRHIPNINVSIRRQKTVTVINCGTYKLLDTYGNKSGFVQELMTIPGFYVSKDSKTIIPFINWKDGLKLVK